MEKWMVTCIILCSFGLLKELRPSEPFLTEYLVGPWKNLTIDEVMQDVYPVWTYSYLAIQIVMFIITDFLLYKPIVVFEGISLILTWCVLIWGKGIPAMQAVEFLYASTTASRIAYSSYIYTQVPIEKFQVVTGYTKAALLVGRCLAGVLGQALILFEVCDYLVLNYITLGCVSAATLIACCLPNVTHSLYFHRNKFREDSRKEYGDIPSPANKGDSSKAHLMILSVETAELQDLKQPVTPEEPSVANLLWIDFRSAYSDVYTLKWSLWWSIATCGFYQTVNYIQPLWESITPPESSTVYNGAVEALHALLGALATLGIGYASIDWSVYGEPIIGAMSLLEGAMLFILGSTDRLWVSYITYIVFCISYRVLITIASSEVAKGLKRESYGLIFGFNTFLALLFQTCLTLIVTDGVGLAFGPQMQFKIYGGYFAVLGAVFSAIASYNILRRRSRACLSKTSMRSLEKSIDRAHT